MRNSLAYQFARVELLYNRTGMLLDPRLRDWLSAHEDYNSRLPCRLHRRHDTLHQLALCSDEGEITEIDVFSRRRIRSWSPKQCLIERPSADKNDRNIGSLRGRDSARDVARVIRPKLASLRKRDFDRSLLG